jgi:hypothetical protein
VSDSPGIFAATPDERKAAGMSETSVGLSARAVAASAAVLLAGAAFAGPAAADPGKGGKGDHGQSSQSGKSHGQSGQAHGHGGQSAKGGSDNGDPAGNNGTFKVDGLPYSDGMANEPHVSCGFRLKFFGFDEGQTGDITITGQAPSGSGVVSSKTGVLISDDAAGGGPNDPDAVVEYAAGDLNLAGLTAHPKQGYHLKVTLSTDTPGGVKHKVFWFEPCATETTPEVGGTGETVTPPTVGGTTGGTTGDTTGDTTEDRTVVPTQVLGVKMNRATEVSADRAGESAQVLGTSFTRTGGLPFTGSLAGILAAIGAGVVAAGGAVLLLARRARHVA